MPGQLTAAGAMLSGVLAGILALAHGVPAEAGPDAACRDCFRAGAATVPLRPPMGTPLAGYGSLARRLLVPDLLDRHPHAFWFKPATGHRDPLRVRALVLEAPPDRVAWVAVDLIAVDRTFSRLVERRLEAAGVGATTLLVSASHTHSGPGAFLDSTGLGWVASDRFDASVRDALADQVVEAIRRADAARTPVLVGAAAVTAEGLVRSRLARPVDPELVVLRITARSGAPVALVWNFAIHGTVLGAKNLAFSGDVMGAAAAELERTLGVPALFVNGAVGDVSPAGHGAAAVAELGRRLAAAARQGWEAAQPVAVRELKTARRRVALPPARLSLRNCAGRWVPRWLRLPLDRLFPRDAELTAVAIDRTAWVSIPGELQTALGLAVKRAGPGLFDRVFVAGVSSDYLGYFVTPEDYDRPSYVTCASLYGARAGECLAATAVSLLNELRGRAGTLPVGSENACGASTGGQG